MSGLTNLVGGKLSVTTTGLGIPPKSAGLVAHYDATSSTGSFTPSRGCIVILRGYGAGGGGGQSGGGNCAGGAGGGAGYAVLPVGAGQTISWSVGAAGAADADGGDTTITLPSGLVLTAGGGKKGDTGGGTRIGGLGGRCTGPWLIARTGGDGGEGNGTGGLAGASSLPGGGTGGGGASNQGGGGGAAGFTDLFPGIAAANGILGNSATPGQTPGGGGSGGTIGGGGAGRMILTAIDAG